MKKKFMGIVLCCLMAFVFLLSGCDLFPRNNYEYLNRAVATITYKDGTKFEISTESFINAFNSYGSSLVQNGTEYNDALEQTVDVLISRYVLINYAKTQLTLDADDKREIFDQVYTSLCSNLDSYINEVREEWNITAPQSNAEENSDVVKYNEFVPTASVVEDNGQLKIKLLEKEYDPETNFASLEQLLEVFKEYANPTDTTNNSKIKKEAYRRFVTILKKNEEGLGLSKNSDEVLSRYAKKLYNSVEENIYITKLEDYYKTSDGYSTISVRQVLNKYKNLMMQSKFKYEANHDTYNSDMLNNFKDVNYVVDDNYFFVSHILMQFDDQQKQEYDNLKTEYNNGYISQQKYKERLDELANQIQAQVRDENGNIIEGQSVKAINVLQSLTTQLKNAKSDEQKAQIMRDYIYKYGQDPGVQNAEYMYVIGKDTSNMVESFNEASRELDKKGVFGEISGLVASDYGVHIIFYGGKVENLFTINDISTFNLKDEDIWKLTTAKLSVLNNKTVFDKIFELLSEDNYSIFENMNLNVLKNDVTIEKHPSVYENL